MEDVDIAIVAAYLATVILLGAYLTWRTRKLKVNTPSNTRAASVIPLISEGLVTLLA